MTPEPLAGHTMSEAALPKPAFTLRWHSVRASYSVSEPDIGDTDCYTADQMRAYARASLAQQAGEDARDGARFRAIESSGRSGTIRIDDELAVCPRYIHWGGATGLDLGAAIDQAMKGGEG